MTFVEVKYILSLENENKGEWGTSMRNFWHKMKLCLISFEYVFVMFVLCFCIFGATHQQTTSNVTVRYTRPSYTITFDASEAGGEVYTKNVKLGDEYGELPIMKKYNSHSGFMFLGWSNSKLRDIDGGGTHNVSWISLNVFNSMLDNVSSYGITFSKKNDNYYSVGYVANGTTPSTLLSQSEMYNILSFTEVGDNLYFSSNNDIIEAIFEIKNKSGDAIAYPRSNYTVTGNEGEINIYFECLLKDTTYDNEVFFPQLEIRSSTGDDEYIEKLNPTDKHLVQKDLTFYPRFINIGSGIQFGGDFTKYGVTWSYDYTANIGQIRVNGTSSPYASLTEMFNILPYVHVGDTVYVTSGNENIESRLQVIYSDDSSIREFTYNYVVTGRESRINLYYHCHEDQTYNNEILTPQAWVI